MNWSYRIIRKTKRIKNKIYHTYDIHEVFYDKNGKMNWTTEPVSPNGHDNVNDLKIELSMMMTDALRLPIMVIKKGKLVERGKNE